MREYTWNGSQVCEVGDAVHFAISPTRNVVLDKDVFYLLCACQHNDLAADIEELINRRWLVWDEYECYRAKDGHTAADLVDALVSDRLLTPKEDWRHERAYHDAISPRLVYKGEP